MLFFGLAVRDLRQLEAAALSRLWKFHFEWNLACITGVSWCYIIELMLPNHYTEWWVISLYACAGTLMYPVAAWLQELKLEHSVEKLELDGRSRHQLSACFGLLMVISLPVCQLVRLQLPMPCVLTDASLLICEFRLPLGSPRPVQISCTISLSCVIFTVIFERDFHILYLGVSA